MDIIFDGYKLNDYVNIDAVQGLGIPVTVDKEIQIMGVNGSMYENTTLEARILTLTCNMFSNTTKTIYERLDDIKKIIAPFKGEKQIELSRYSDRYIMGRYSGTMDIEQHAMVQNFPLSFRCSDPLWYSKTEYNATIIGSLAVVNNGSWPTNNAYVTFTANTNATVTVANTTTGKQFVVKNDATPRSFKVNFKNGKITDLTETVNYFKYHVSGDPCLPLNPGSNSIVISGNAGICSLKYRYAWI